MTDRNTISQVVESLFEDWIDKNINLHPLAVENMRILEADAIKLLKEREPVDRNTGEWKNGHCSCCGEDVSSMLDTWTNVQNFLFCPNCGAKMEGR